MREMNTCGCNSGEDDLERLYECPECKRLIWRRKDGKIGFYDLFEEIRQRNDSTL